MEKAYKHGEKIFYLHPKYGLMDYGAVNLKWNLMICDVRQAVFIEYSDFMDRVKIMPKGRNKSIEIPLEFIDQKKEIAQEIMRNNNEFSWHNIFKYIIRMEKELAELRGKFKKLKEL